MRNIRKNKLLVLGLALIGGGVTITLYGISAYGLGGVHYWPYNVDSFLGLNTYLNYRFDSLSEVLQVGLAGLLVTMLGGIATIAGLVRTRH